MNWILHSFAPFALVALVALAAPLALIDFPGAFALCCLALLLRWLRPEGT